MGYIQNVGDGGLWGCGERQPTFSPHLNARSVNPGQGESRRACPRYPRRKRYIALPGSRRWCSQDLLSSRCPSFLPAGDAEDNVIRGYIYGIERRELLGMFLLAELEERKGTCLERPL